MINVYKNRAMFFLFGIILIINTVLMASVFFAFSSIIERDYTEKLTSVASQTSVNANSIFLFFEEEIEVFINKYNVEKGLGNFRFDSPNFVRMDSTNFEKISIFKGEEPVYASSAEIVDFYRETGFDKKIIDFAKRKSSGWIIKEDKDDVLSPYESLAYVRTIYDADTKEIIGCVIAEVSQKQLIRLLNLDTKILADDQKGFLPHSVGICVDSKIFFLGDGNVPKIISDTRNFEVGRNERYFVNSMGEKKFYTVHNTKILKKKILLVLFLFIGLFLVIMFFSYRIFKFMLNEICERMDNLNRKIENYGDKSL